jgi:hypothetical protein
MFSIKVILDAETSIKSHYHRKFLVKGIYQTFRYILDIGMSDIRMLAAIFNDDSASGE